jgi:hypothetical protein
MFERIEQPIRQCSTRREYIPVGSTAASLLPTVLHCRIG